MKQFILIASLLNFFLCFSQLTSVPDPNFEDYLEQNGMGDGVPNNSLVLTANIENVLSLIMDYKAIQDLTGIQDFTQLRILNCAGNNIPLLDVSQNMNLEFLNCQASNVAQLLLPPTASLENLRCPENSLTSLDISQNPGLFQLECQINNLTQLDLTHNPALEIVEASFNNMSGALDTSQNPLLSFLSIIDNGISAVNLSQNPLILTFNASNNSFESLDARNGNNENIEYFSASGTHGLLSCILVDDANAPYLASWLKDTETSFVNNQAECDALGVEDMEGKNIAIYPNPANEIVTINLPNISSYILFDSNLKKLKSGVLNSGNNIISVLGFDAGVYFLRINSDQEFFTKKLVVY